MLADLIDVHTVEEGEVLVPEGATDRNLYVVVNGVIEVSKPDEGGQVDGAARPRPGRARRRAVFHGRRTALRRAARRAKTTVFSLSRGRFELLLHEHPWVVYKTMRAIMRTAHAIQRRLSMHMIELSNYFFKSHPKY